MKPFVLTNAQIVTPRQTFLGAVFVQNGKIVEVKKGKAQLKKGFAHLDLQGKYLFPGLIDAHVHFRTPGMTKKEDWTSGSRAALAGGVTTVLDMPNTVPPTIDEASLEQKRELVAKKALINYGFFVGATAQNLAEVKKLKNIAGVKIYMGSSTGNLLIKDKKILESFMSECSETGPPVSERRAPTPNVPALGGPFRKGRVDPPKHAPLVAHSGKLLVIHAEKDDCISKNQVRYGTGDDPAIHSRIREPKCAYEAVKEVLGLLKKYPKARVHFAHVTTAAELKLISDFKKSEPDLAPNVTVEVTPHHLFLTERDYETYGNLVKVNPPLRSLKDSNALWQGIQNGVVDIVATDHAPHLLEEKKLPYPEAPAGVPGVQTVLPLLLHAVNKGRLSLEELAQLTSAMPAKLFGLKNKGKIEEGYDADLTVVDLDLEEKVCHHYLWTKCQWSPFHGWVLKGWPVMTLVGGELMYEWREKFGRKLGREVEIGNEQMTNEQMSK
jgi:dihydroorotase